jgi:hypothetical protein
MSNQQPQQEEIILLPISPNGAPNESFRRLWNRLTGISSNQISQILRMMNRERLLSFLEFMHQICLHDPSIADSQRQLEHYQIILMCCPRLILAEYLRSIDEQCRINLLEHCDVIWTMYFVGLIELGHEIEVYIELHNLMIIYDENFIFSLVLLLVQEMSNPDLPRELRQSIYVFVCRNPQIVLMIVQREHEVEQASIEQLYEGMNQWSWNLYQRNGFDYFPQWMISNSPFVREPQREHRAVNAEDFVRRTFASLHPLAPNRVYQCGICQSGPDETNEDGSIKVFRSMNCCPQQMCCHNCLVHQATACNTPDREFKNTSVFICPFARHETGFFPPNP